MKARNLYLLLAREVMHDSSDQMVSVVKIIDKFTATVDKNEFENNVKNSPKKFTVLPFSYAVGTSWVLEKKLEEDTLLKIMISILDPDNKNLDGPEQENLFPKGVSKVNINFTAQGLPATKSGHYNVHAKLTTKDNKLLAESNYPFEIDLKWQEKES